MGDDWMRMYVDVLHGGATDLGGEQFDATRKAVAS